MAGGLELVGDDVLDLLGGNSEGDQSGRHIQALEGTGHGILTADGGDLQIHLGIESAEQSSQGLAPTLGIVAQTLEILLEGPVHILKLGTGGHQLGGGLHNSEVCAVVGAVLGDEGVVAPGHDGAVVGVALLQADLVDHGLDGSVLISAAEGHQDGACADGGVETLRQAPLGAGIQVGGDALEILHKAAVDFLLILAGGSQLDGNMLLGTVGVQEVTAYIADGSAVPVHDQTDRKSVV